MTKFWKIFFGALIVLLLVLYSNWLTKGTPGFEISVLMAWLVIIGYAITRMSEKVSTKWRNLFPKDAITYFWTLIATLIGVYAAFWLTDRDANNKKLANELRWLKMTHEDLVGKTRFLDTWIYNKVKAPMKDWNHNSVDFPLYVLQNQEVVSNLSPTCFAQLSMFLDRMAKMVTFVGQHTDSGWNESSFHYYLKSLKIMAIIADEIVQDEFEYLDGKATLDMLEERTRRHMYDLSVDTNQNDIQTYTYNPAVNRYTRPGD